jgi:CubicO group peptidase (beta-lactamase class C family)
MKRLLPLLGLMLGTNMAQTQNQPLSQVLETLRMQNNVPALAAAIVKNGVLLESAAVGERALGSGIKVELTDAFHLGSISKSFTATIIAKLVEQGLLRFDSSLETLFAEIPMLEVYRKVTIDQLLTHRAGFIANVPDAAPYNWNLEPREARKLYLETALKTAPINVVGSAVSYSNVGYVLASLAAERATGKTWEQLIREIIFEPLKMTTCSFGTRFIPLTMPHGHMMQNGRMIALSPDQPNGNPPVLYGADGVRCGIEDTAKYAIAHLRGERGEDGIILKASSFQALHLARAASGQLQAAYGWFVYPNGTIWHNGSNTQNYAEVLFHAKGNYAIVVTTNAPTNEGRKAVQATQQILFERLR